MDALLQALSSDRALTLLGILGAWFLAMPSAPGPFSEVELRFSFLVKCQVRGKDMQRDYKWLWRKLPLPFYWFLFIVWHMFMTLGVFWVIYVFSFVQWRWAKWREGEVEKSGRQANIQERPTSLHRTLTALGTVFIGLAVVGVVIRVVSWLGLMPLQSS